ncbi:Inactive dipeptidyl peptidase 10 [Nymphon striatum]|nr:Inactive dipeptidyl peptidase 10 [Nymphon striatum]
MSFCSSKAKPFNSLRIFMDISRQHKVEDYSMSRDRRYLLLTLSKKKIHSYTYKARYLIYAIANHIDLNYLCPCPHFHDLDFPSKLVFVSSLHVTVLKNGERASPPWQRKSKITICKMGKRRKPACNDFQSDFNTNNFKPDSESRSSSVFTEEYESRPDDNYNRIEIHRDNRMHFGKINELILARKTVSNFKNSHLSRDVTQGTNIVGMANSEARLPVTLFPRLKINITSEDELSSCEEFDHHHHYFQFSQEFKIGFFFLMYSKYFVMHTKITLRLFNLFQMYIYRNNIYYAVNVKQALNKNEIQLTQDGNVGVYFNGIPDWLYEEEIFKSNNAVWWSPKGDYLCYASINDSKVQSMVYPIYGPFSDPNNLYPRLEALRYPKPGTKNPIIKLWVVDLKNNLKIPREIFPPSQIRNQEHYVTSVSWIDNTRLSVIWITRSQNLSVIGECILNKQQCFTRSKENAPGGPEGKAWVEMFDPPVHGAYKYYLRLPIANSRSGYFQHIAKLKFMENRKQFLTRGEYEVTKIISFDRETETLFYIANRVGKAGERHLYSVADHRFTNHHEPKCLTCDIGNECLYNDAKFSPNHKYYILECLGPGVPYSALYRIHNNTFGNYGGPGTQNVKEEFKVDWSTYLTTYWGWAYGGYVVTRAMTSPYGNSFQCGIAVAPVTSWLYQDSFYTERYMQTFEENRIGYLDADALLGAADLKDKKFLLIHGSADDHVHFQQSMMLAMALNSNGVMYRSQFYPDESHDLAGVKEHLYRTMGGFLDECFEQSEMDFYS